MLTNMQRSVSEYVATVKELKDNLLSESKFAGSAGKGSMGGNNVRDNICSSIWSKLKNTNIN